MEDVDFLTPNNAHEFEEVARVELVITEGQGLYPDFAEAFQGGFVGCGATAEKNPKGRLVQVRYPEFERAGNTME